MIKLLYDYPLIDDKTNEVVLTMDNFFDENLLIWVSTNDDGGKFLKLKWLYGFRNTDPSKYWHKCVHLVSYQILDKSSITVNDVQVAILEGYSLIVDHYKNDPAVIYCKAQEYLPYPYIDVILADEFPAKVHQEILL